MGCTLFFSKNQCPVGPTALRSVAPAQPNERKKQMVRRIARSSFPICSPSFAAPALYQGATRLPGRAPGVPRQCRRGVAVLMLQVQTGSAGLWADPIPTLEGDGFELSVK